MSFILGPIHTWLFTKIRFQDQLQKTILKDYEKDNKDTTLSHQLDRRFGMLEEGELKDIVEEGNIHGWLQERVSLVENRLAFMVTQMIQTKPEYMHRIKEIAFEVGRSHAISNQSTVHQAYKMLDDLLLNGMPCDGVNEITQESEDILVWIQTKDIHKPYWESIGGDVENYNTIRENLIAGLLSQSGFTIRKTTDQTYELKKVV